MVRAKSIPKAKWVRHIHIPPQKIQSLFVKFEEREVKLGEQVVREGEAGDIEDGLGVARMQELAPSLLAAAAAKLPQWEMEKWYCSL